MILMLMTKSRKNNLGPTKLKAAPEKTVSNHKVIAENRKARFDYFISDRYEAGVKLVGFEVKSIREGKVNLKDSFVRILHGEAFLINCHISHYSHIQGHLDVDARATRKLLLKREELEKLGVLTSQKGYAIIPLSLYFKRGLVKIEIGVGKGKQQFDKRDTIKKRIHDRESNAAIKKYTKG